MRLIRIHLDQALARGARVTLSGAAATHVSKVLRLAPGDAVTLFNGDGTDYPSRIDGLARGAVEIEVLATAPAAPESPLLLRLVQGIPRGERMDLVVQKATELGVGGIQPVVAARSVVRLDGAAGERRQAHWRGVAIAACEQCGRAKIPHVAAPLTLAAWLARPAAAGVRRVQLATDAGQPLVDAVAGARDVELLAGPEGGLDEAEIASAERAGYLRCRLGPRTLRSETAAIAAIAVLQAIAGDLG